MITLIAMTIYDNNIFVPYSLDVSLNTSLILSVLGFFLVMLGGFGRIWASLYIEGFKTKTLIKEGPYSMVRNPLYVFSLMIFTGLCLAIKSIPISIALITIFTLFHIPTILNEEKTLLDTHDESYREYYKSTPRLFPNIFKYRKPKSTDRIEVKIERINKRLWEVIGYLVLFVIIDGYWISSLL
ncbi:MAG: isoprenylcysteine carboxylmethyltransferase family protein [Candidatus Neomarinimicrobiota bacterium]|nr:isoprenylcysteine carboxylmethyltransferase family protein [Candidatus Neomarinimicrobiota bacterium]